MGCSWWPQTVLSKSLILIFAGFDAFELLPFLAYCESLEF
jgi:hypothetical protein